MNENDLRDCFAMFAMLGLTTKYGNDDNPEARAQESYRMADAMLKVRNAEPEQEVGIVAVKSRRKKND
jgi:hypothetical protein